MKKYLDFKDKKNILVLLLMACAVCQFLIIQYFNFFEADIHIGVDASWEYLKAMVMGKNGGFYPTDLLNSTTAPSNDKVFLLVAPLYRIFKNVWVAFATTNMIILLGTIAIMWAAMSDVKFGIIEKLIVINMFICPYLCAGYTIQNDLGYFSCVFGVVAYYNMMVLEFMMIVRVLALDNILSLKSKIWVGVSIAAMCFTGASDGPVMVIMALVPAIGFVFIKMFIENDAKVLIQWKSIYLYAAFIAVSLGKVFGGMAGLPYQEDVRLWTTAAQLWSNIGNLICGYMMLLGGIPGTGLERSPLEFRGFVYVLGLVIFVVLAISFFYWAIKTIKAIRNHTEVDSHILFLLSVIVVDFLEFSLVFTSYGEDIFERRYLIISTMAAFFLAGYFIKDLSDKLIFKWFGVIVLFACIVGADLTSDYLYKIDDNLSWKAQEIQEAVEATDAGLVYTWGKELTPVERCLRVYDDSRIYKAITRDFVLETFGDYSYYDDSKQYQGPTVLIVSTDDPAAPQEVLDQYELVDTLSYVSVYYSKTNPVDLQYWIDYGKQQKAKQ